jgi:hypothetical protein
LERTRHWVRAVRPDGLRIDAVGHLPPGFLRALKADLQAEGLGDTVLLGEVFEGDAYKLARGRDAAGLDAAFDFPFHFAAIDTFCNGGPLGKMAVALASARYSDDPRRLVTFLDNHDRERVFTACGHDEEATRAALNFLFAVRGVPSLTYGTAAGLRGKAEVDVRSDMRWDREPFFEVIRRAQGIRRTHPSLSRGTSHVVSLGEQVLQIVREADGEFASVQINRTGGPVALPVALPVVGAEPFWTVIAQPGVSMSFFRSDNAAVSEGWREAWEAQPDRVSVRLQVASVELAPDEELWLVGEGPELGGWVPEQAIGPFERAGEGFELGISLPPWTPMAAKLVARTAEGVARWAEGPDQTLFFVQQGQVAVLKW